MRRLVALLALALAAMPGAVRAGEAEKAERLVTLGGTVTEVAFALGLGDSIVGVDQSSLFPAAAQKLPQVGYYRSVAAEGILSLRPTLVVASEDAGPPAALDLVRGAGVEILTLPSTPTLEAARARIERLAERTGRQAEAAAAIAAIDASLAAAREAVACVRAAPPKVLFLFGRGGGNVAAAGGGTAAQAMIELAGATNSVGASFQGYRPLGAEAVIAAAPDVVVTTTHAVRTLGGEQAVLDLPGLALTPAGKAKRLVVLDDLLLLGFGPRVGDAVAALAGALRQGRSCASGS